MGDHLRARRSLVRPPGLKASQAEEALKTFGLRVRAKIEPIRPTNLYRVYFYNSKALDALTFDEQQALAKRALRQVLGDKEMDRIISFRFVFDESAP